MKALIPAAGIGTRLRPHTFSQPKALLNVAGKPIIGHILDSVIAIGIVDIIIIVGYKSEAIKNYVAKNYSVNVTFVFQEHREGLGHSIWVAKDYIDPDDQLLVILGDTIIKAPLDTMVSSTDHMIAIQEVSDPRRFGIVELDQQTQKVHRFVEKPQNPTSNSAIVGLYYFSSAKALLDTLDTIISNNERTLGEFQLTDALQRMLEKGEPFKAIEVSKWFDCGKPETLLATNAYLLDLTEQVHYKLDNAIIIPPVYISSSATIRRSVIGPNVTISENVVIEDSILKNSIVNSHAVVTSSLLDSSIIGEYVALTGTFTSVNVGDSSIIVSK
jgi:glucose-1-phosphate thymidylyltransferase